MGNILICNNCLRIYGPSWQAIAVTYSACCMSSLLRCDPQAIVQSCEARFWDSQQALGIADRGLSTPQRQQDGLKRWRHQK